MSVLACGEPTSPEPCANLRDCLPWFRPFNPPLATILATTIPTYEGSGQTVHPDVVRVPAGLSADRFGYWLAITPYPGGDAHFENPSVLASMNPQSWGVPDGLVNPLVSPQDVELPRLAEDGFGIEDEAGEFSRFDAGSGHGHFSDPDLVWTDHLDLYVRYAAGSDYIFRMNSRDGVVWSPPQLVLTGPFASILSPAVVAGSGWRMWAVDAQSGGCQAATAEITLRESADGTVWSDPARLDLTIPGYVPWHLDVQRIPDFDEYWALIPAYPHGESCGATDLFFATSIDGLTWRVLPTPVLRRQGWAGFQNAVYRSTFWYDAGTDEVTVWYSGYTANEWRTAVERIRRKEFVKRAGGDPDATEQISRALSGHGSRRPHG